MNKTKLIWLITGGAIILIGLSVIVLAMSETGWDLRNLSGKYVTTEHEITQDFNDISIDSDTERISFILSDDEKCKVVCSEPENMKHTVAVSGGALKISVKDERKWFERISLFSSDQFKTTVYLPKKDYTSLVIDTDTGDIDIPKDFAFKNIDISGSTCDVKCSASAEGKTGIKLSTGDIRLDGVDTGELELSVSTGAVTLQKITCKGGITVGVSTGKAELSDVKCGSLTSSGSTGVIHMDNVTATGAFNIDRSTGDITFDSCDAAELYIKTSTGSVSGTLLSDKVFITDTSTGDIDVPKTITGGRCEITTTTGDIRISIK